MAGSEQRHATSERRTVSDGRPRKPRDSRRQFDDHEPAGARRRLIRIPRRRNVGDKLQVPGVQHRQALQRRSRGTVLPQ